MMTNLQAENANIGSGSFEKLKRKIQKSWSRGTAHPDFADRWSDDNKSAGQCAVTALIVNDHLGGEVAKIYVNGVSHYFNIVNGEVVDLTKEQFGDSAINYSNYKLRSREDLLADSNTNERYRKLKIATAELNAFDDKDLTEEESK